MDSIAIVLEKPIPLVEIKAFVVKNGGEWNEDVASLKQGSFTENGSWVFLRGVDTQIDDVRFISSMDKLEALKELRELGAVLTFDHSKTEASKFVANELASKLLGNYKGIAMSDS